MSDTVRLVAAGLLLASSTALFFVATADLYLEPASGRRRPWLLLALAIGLLLLGALVAR